MVFNVQQLLLSSEEEICSMELFIRKIYIIFDNIFILIHMWNKFTISTLVFLQYVLEDVHPIKNTRIIAVSYHLVGGNR